MLFPIVKEGLERGEVENRYGFPKSLGRVPASGFKITIAKNDRYREAREWKKR
jgi:hypothetical protein